MKRFAIKPKIFFGVGSVEYLDKMNKATALLVTDPYMVKSGTADVILSIWKTNQVKYEIFSGVKPDPSIDVVAEGVAMMLNLKPDLMVALGGGSTIDAAKSILSLSGKIESGMKKPLFIAIPTTSGTGSEVTSFCIITDGDKKITIVNDELVPDIAIIDANFVKTAPPRITADTGIDALTHAIEAYVSTAASDYSDALAEKSMKMIFDSLSEAYHNGNDMVAREKLHNASCMAGMAFTTASLGINHSLAHALGGMFHVPHGRANAVLLPYVIKYNANMEAGTKGGVPLKYAALAEVLGLKIYSTTDGVNKLICAINSLLKETDTPMSLKALKIDKNDLLEKVETMASTALADKCTATNPRIPNKKELIKLYLQAYGED